MPKQYRPSANRGKSWNDPNLREARFPQNHLSNNRNRWNYNHQGFHEDQWPSQFNFADDVRDFDRHFYSEERHQRPAPQYFSENTNSRPRDFKSNHTGEAYSYKTLKHYGNGNYRSSQNLANDFIPHQNRQQSFRGQRGGRGGFGYPNITKKFGPVENDSNNDINSWLLETGGNNKAPSVGKRKEETVTSEPPPGSEEARSKSIKETTDRLKKSLLNKKTTVNINLLAKDKVAPTSEKPKPYTFGLYRDLDQLELDANDMRAIGRVNGGQDSIFDENAVNEKEIPDIILSKSNVPTEVSDDEIIFERIFKRDKRQESKTVPNQTDTKSGSDSSKLSPTEVVQSFVSKTASSTSTPKRTIQTHPSPSTLLSTPNSLNGSPNTWIINKLQKMSKTQIQELINNPKRVDNTTINELIKKHRLMESREQRRIAESKFSGTTNDFGENTQDDAAFSVDFAIDWKNLPSEVLSTLKDLFGDAEVSSPCLPVSGDVEEYQDYFEVDSKALLNSCNFQPTVLTPIVACSNNAEYNVPNPENVDVMEGHLNQPEITGLIAPELEENYNFIPSTCQGDRPNATVRSNTRNQTFSDICQPLPSKIDKPRRNQQLKTSPNTKRSETPSSASSNSKTFLELKMKSNEDAKSNTIRVREFARLNVPVVGEKQTLSIQSLENNVETEEFVVANHLSDTSTKNIPALTRTMQSRLHEENIERTVRNKLQELDRLEKKTMRDLKKKYKKDQSRKPRSQQKTYLPKAKAQTPIRKSPINKNGEKTALNPKNTDKVCEQAVPPASVSPPAEHVETISTYDSEGMSMLPLLMMTVPSTSPPTVPCEMDEAKIIQRISEIDDQLQSLIKEKLYLTNALKEKVLSRNNAEVQKTEKQVNDKAKKVNYGKKKSNKSAKIANGRPKEDSRGKKRKSLGLNTNGSTAKKKQRKTVASGSETVANGPFKDCFVHLEVINSNIIEAIGTQSSNNLHPGQSRNVDLESTVLSEKSFNSSSFQFQDRKRLEFDSPRETVYDIQILNKQLLTSTEKGNVYMYSCKSGNRKKVFTDDSINFKYGVTCMAVDKKSKLLYTGGTDGYLRCFDLESTARKCQPMPVSNSIQCMELMWDHIYIGTKAGCIVPYSLQSGTLKEPLSRTEFPIYAITCTMEGPRKVLIVATRNQPVVVRDALSGLLLRTLGDSWRGTVYKLLLESSYLYCGGDQQTIKKFDFQSGQLKKELKCVSAIVSMKLFYGLLFAAGYDTKIYIFDAEEEELVSCISGTGSMILCIEIWEDKVIVGSKDCELKAVDIPEEALTIISRRSVM